MRPRFGQLGILVLLILVARREIDVVEVRGTSMYPTLRPGDRLVLIRQRGAPAVGQVVVVGDPRDASRELVKRVASVDARGIELRGDNPARSTDGRTFGRVPTAAARWRAIARYWPRQRVGGLLGTPPLVADGGEPACAFPTALIASGE